MTKTTLTSLSNGLRVAMTPDGAIPQVGIALYYDVGSRNETLGCSGFAHLFEHMMFQGSANVPKGDHFRQILAWGGDLNGTTSQDCTNYYESLPAHQLNLGLWLEADRMRSLAVNDDNFENQRQTVMEERRERVDNSPYGEAFVRIGELSHSCWAYSHPVIGSWEDLENAKLEQVRDFHKRWYRPDNAVLAISGDFDPDEAMDTVHQFFGGIPAGGERPEPDLREALRTEPIHERITDPLAQLPAVLLNLPAPPYGDPDFYTYEVIETLLFRGPSSRLYRRLVIDEATAVQVGGGYEAHRGPSLFSLLGVASAGCELSPLVDGFFAELQRLRDTPVTEAELSKVLNQLKTGRVFGRESVLNRALALGRSVLYHGDPHWEDTYLTRVARVTAEDIVRIAERDFDPELRVVLEVEPAG